MGWGTGFKYKGVSHRTFRRNLWAYNFAHFAKQNQLSLDSIVINKMLQSKMPTDLDANKVQTISNTFFPTTTLTNCIAIYCSRFPLDLNNKGVLIEWKVKVTDWSMLVTQVTWCHHHDIVSIKVNTAVCYTMKCAFKTLRLYWGDSHIGETEQQKAHLNGQCNTMAFGLISSDDKHYWRFHWLLFPELREACVSWGGGGPPSPFKEKKPL